MAVAAIPEEINRHIEAVLALSKRDVLLRILHEADLCFQSEQVTAAGILAGIALEEISLLTNQTVSDQHQGILAFWREMRNRAVHALPGGAELDKEAVRGLITGARTLREDFIGAI